MRGTAVACGTRPRIPPTAAPNATSVRVHRQEALRDRTGTSRTKSIVAATRPGGHDPVLVDATDSAVTRTRVPRCDQTASRRGSPRTTRPECWSARGCPSWGILEPTLGLRLIDLADEPQAWARPRPMGDGGGYAKTGAVRTTRIGQLQAIRTRPPRSSVDRSARRGCGPTTAARRAGRRPSGGGQGGSRRRRVLHAANGEHPDPRWHRLHVGSPGGTSPQAPPRQIRPVGTRHAAAPGGIATIHRALGSRCHDHHPKPCTNLARGGRARRPLRSRDRFIARCTREPAGHADRTSCRPSTTPTRLRSTTSRGEGGTG